MEGITLCPHSAGCLATIYQDVHTLNNILCLDALMPMGLYVDAGQHGALAKDNEANSTLNGLLRAMIWRRTGVS